MLTDPKKSLSITYNELNKTNRLHILANWGRYIDYTYDAGGNLLRKQVYDAYVLQKTTDYIDGFVYENGTLAYFPMAEGRVRNNSGTLKNEFMITDQLGNVRVSFEESSGVAVVRQENSYYPFGLIMPGGYTPSSPNKNLYNAGSEWQEDFGDLPDLYSTFYRNYDAALGRFVAVDPMADAAESWTSYQYGYNNPLIFNDPLGDLTTGEFDYLVDALWNTPHGGHWSEDSGYQEYASDDETYDAGLKQLKANGYWEYWTNRGGGGYEFSAATKTGANGKGFELVLTAKKVANGNNSNGYRTKPESGRKPTDLNPRTIGRNLVGLTYAGGKNPKSYNGQDNFSYVPQHLADYPAIGHDRRYGNLGIAGLSGLLTDPRAIGADWQFVWEELQIASIPSLSTTDRLSALFVSGLGILSLPKTAIILSNPHNYSMVQSWYNISNTGVTNAPSNR